MLCRANASRVSRTGLEAATDSELSFPIGGVSFCSGVHAPEVLMAGRRVRRPLSFAHPSDVTSLLDSRHVYRWFLFADFWEAIMVKLRLVQDAT